MTTAEGERTDPMAKAPPVPAGSGRRAPLWLKVGFTLWVAVWIPFYWDHYGPQNFLWFCDIGNFILCAAIWTERRLLFSWQAVSLLVVQTAWTLDIVGRLILGVHLIGGSEYMFDPAIPLVIRLLSLFHGVTPVLLAWALWRYGYDPRAWKVQCVMAWIVLPICFALGPDFNINWVWGPFDRPQTILPSWLYFLLCLIGYPVLLYAPVHFILSRLLGTRGGNPRLSPNAAAPVPNRMA